jgi:predicted nucleic acid-binding protein
MIDSEPGGGPQGPMYIDSSALAKLYLPEPGSDELNEAIEGRRDLLASELAVTEVVSSLCRRRREAALSSELVARLHRAVLADLGAGFYRRLELTPDSHREAERLLQSLEAVALRAADALHLALALAGEARAVATFDRRLAEAARALGLAVIP